MINIEVTSGGSASINNAHHQLNAAGTPKVIMSDID
jgi:hypothetical protein